MTSRVHTPQPYRFEKWQECIYMVHMTFFHELITLRFNYHSYIPKISLKTF